MNFLKETFNKIAVELAQVALMTLLVLEGATIVALILFPAVVALVALGF